MLHYSLFSDPAELLLSMDSASSVKSRFSGEGSLRPSRAAAVEQWARQSSGHAPKLLTGIQRRGSDSIGNQIPMF